MGRGKRGHGALEPSSLQGVPAPLGAQPGRGRAPAGDHVDPGNVPVSYNCTLWKGEGCSEQLSFVLPGMGADLSPCWKPSDMEVMPTSPDAGSSARGGCRRQE